MCLTPLRLAKMRNFYHDCKIYEAWKKQSMVFLGGVVQLAFLVSSFYRSNINGHAIRLHKTHNSAASLIGHFCTPDHTILHGHVSYWVPKYNVSTIVAWGKQNKQDYVLVHAGYRLLVKISYCQLEEKHIKARYFANLLHENLYPRVFSEGYFHLFIL